MRVIGVHAENFLSFAPDDIAKEDHVCPAGDEGKSDEAPRAGLHLANLSPTLTLLVGPNGSGKTNVIRVVQAILAGLETPYPSESAQAHRIPHIDYPLRPTILQMDVEWDDHELGVLRAAWLTGLLAYRQDSAWSQLKKHGDATNNGNIYPKDDQLSALNSALENAVRTMDLEPLRKGTLRLAYDTTYPDRYTVHYDFSLHGQSISLSVVGNNAGFLAGSDAGGSYRSLRETTADLIKNQGQEDAFARFLDGEDVPLPEVPDLGPVVLIPFGLDNRATIMTSLNPSSMSTVPSQRVSLNRLLGWPPASQEGLSLGTIVALLVRRAIICETTWVIPDVCHLEDVPWETDTLLSAGHLPLYLFRLKNGSPVEKSQFVTVCRWFRDLTDQTLDVALETIRDGDHHAHAKVRLVTDRGIPITNMGAGRGRLAYLAALLTQHTGKVVCLDEPEVHVYPYLQGRVAEKMAQSGAQYLVTTHAPTLVQGVGLNYVRRLTIQDQITCIREVTERSLPKEAWDKLRPNKRWSTADDLMILFANQVVFVEGATDAAVLPEWFRHWSRSEGLSPDDQLAQRLGLRWHPSGGKNGVAVRARLATLFGIPWVALYDADVLGWAIDRETQQEVAGENGTVLAEWVKYKFVLESVSQGDVAAIPHLPARSNQKLFLCGTTVHSNLDQLSMFRGKTKDATIYRAIASAEGITPTLKEEFPQLTALFRQVWVQRPIRIPTARRKLGRRRLRTQA